MLPFACDSCGALYSVERKRLGPRGFRIRCGQCGAAIATGRRRAARFLSFLSA
ncbi:MAG: zinc-ribbon domain-containing protein [Deltaproteobacteria bacterium]|nr:zinc-ribbon domain-containing protein [Deltaproteobacteria bacterium]